MKKSSTVLLIVCVLWTIFLPFVGWAEEIPTGGTKEFVIDSDTWRVIFRERRDRVCVVDLQKLEKRDVVFSKLLTFDFARGERHERINSSDITIFHVEKGVIVLVDGREI